LPSRAPAPNVYLKSIEQPRAAALPIHKEHSQNAQSVTVSVPAKTTRSIQKSAHSGYIVSTSLVTVTISSAVSAHSKKAPLGQKSTSHCTASDSFVFERKADLCSSVKKSSEKCAPVNYEAPSPFFIDSNPFSLFPSYNGEELKQMSFLGGGGFGKVFLCEGNVTRSQYAVKCILRRLTFTRDIINEMRIMDSIDSVFVLKHHATFQKDRNYMMVLEPCPRGDVLNWREQCLGYVFDEASARFLVSNMVIAIEHVHASGILHRDIKSENFLLSDDGYLKLADFGISCTITGSPLYDISGTAPFMCPEMVDHNLPGYSFPADYWSLGICVYQLLTGKLPESKYRYPATSNLNLEFPPTLSKNGKDFITDLLTRDPNKRLGGKTNPCRDHPWFAKMDWKALENHEITSPIT